MHPLSPQRSPCYLLLLIQAKVIESGDPDVLGIERYSEYFLFDSSSRRSGPRWCEDRTLPEGRGFNQFC